MAETEADLYIDPAIELLAPLQSGATTAAIAGGRAAIEALLGYCTAGQQLIETAFEIVPVGFASSKAVNVIRMPETQEKPLLAVNFPSPPAVVENWTGLRRFEATIRTTIRLAGVKPDPLTMALAADPVPCFDTVIARGAGGVTYGIPTLLMDANPPLPAPLKD